MHYPLAAIPQDVDMAGMAVACTTLPQGFDFDQVFQALPNHLCPCPHWGYLLKGRIIVKYEDGSEEDIRAGEVYYLPAGHGAKVAEESITIDFSPIGPWRQLLQQLAMASPAGA